MVTNSMVKLYASIPIYPESVSIGVRKCNFAIEAPLAEDEKGRICYPTQKDKDRWMKQIIRDKS